LRHLGGAKRYDVRRLKCGQPALGAVLTLMWCFLGLRGRIGREAFALAMMALLIASVLIKLKLHWPMLDLVDGYAFVALQAKRVQDMGFAIIALVPAFVFIAFASLIDVGLAGAATCLWLLVLLLVPAGFVARKDA